LRNNLVAKRKSISINMGPRHCHKPFKNLELPGVGLRGWHSPARPRDAMTTVINQMQRRGRNCLPADCSHQSLV
jgi:hypothetical protein